MIFNKEQDNFKIFFNKWRPDDEYVLYGASKDAAQLIISLKKIFKKKILNIKYIIDDDQRLHNTELDLYSLNKMTYKHYDTEKDEITNSKILIKSYEDFKKDQNNYKIIISSDSNYNTIKQKLNNENLKEDVDFCKYKKILSIWPYILLNKTHIWRIDLLLTEKCTLNCTFCNMYMPHYKSPKHKSLEKIKKDLDIFFQKVDFVSIFHLVGGEPFLYPYVKDVINYIGQNYRSKIDHLLITTNGTLVPKNDVFQLIKEHKILLSISDYTDGINYSRRLDQMIEAIKKYQIKYFIRKDIKWSDFGDPNIKKIPNDKILEHFDKCTAPYRGLYDKKIYYCHLNTSAVLSNIVKDDENNYVDIERENSEEILKFDLGYIKKGYVTFCQNCNGCNTGIDIPVSPSDQGLRG